MPETPQQPIAYMAAQLILDRIELTIKPEEAADIIHEVTAHVVAGLIDAGSERDAVMENQELADAISKEFRGWHTPLGWRPQYEED